LLTGGGEDVPALGKYRNRPGSVLSGEGALSCGSQRGKKKGERGGVEENLLRRQKEDRPSSHSSGQGGGERKRGGPCAHRPYLLPLRPCRTGWGVFRCLKKKERAVSNLFAWRVEKKRKVFDPLRTKERRPVHHDGKKGIKPTWRAKNEDYRNFRLGPRRGSETFGFWGGRKRE